MYNIQVIFYSLFQEVLRNCCSTGPIPYELVIGLLQVVWYPGGPIQVKPPLGQLQT